MLARLRWHGRLAVPSLSQALALPSLPQCCSHLFAFSAYFVLKERDPLLRGDSSFHPDRETDKALPRESCTHKQPLPRSLPRSDPLSFCIRPFSGHFVDADGPRVRHIFSVVPRMFPSSEVIPDVNKREGEREKRRRRIRKDTFSSVGKTRWLVSLVRKEGGNLRKFFVLPLLANPNPAVAEENDVIAGRSRWERRFR